MDISQNSKGGPFGSAGDRIPEGGFDPQTTQRVPPLYYFEIYPCLVTEPENFLKAFFQKFASGTENLVKFSKIWPLNPLLLRGKQTAWIQVFFLEILDISIKVLM